MPERKPWSEEQDQILKHIYDDLGLKKWSEIARKMNQQFNMPVRTGKQCRQRYQNSLDSTVVKSQWTFEEELQLYKLHDEIGNKWVNIAKHIPGRTDNCVKNHFFSKLRKSVRKLNKIILQNFKKQIKEIRLLVINKIIEATDEKFKTFPSISNHLIYLSNRLKNMLLDYSKDQENQFEGNLQLLKEMILEVHQFTQTYKRKPKKLRKNPHVHANSHTSKANILIVPKVQRFKFAEDAEQNQSDFELASNEESIQIGDPNQAILNKIARNEKIEMVLDNEELGKSMDKNIKQSINDSMEKSSDVEIILRNAGILQNRNMFSMLFLKQSMSESRNSEEKEKPEAFNFGDSIQNLNFLRQPKEEDVQMGHKLFENS